MNIGAIFRDVRKRLGITLVDLGHLVDIDSGNLSRFENGKQGMTTETLYKVMKALEISFAGPGIENQDAYLYPLLKWKGIGAFLSSGKVDGRVLKSTQSAGEGAFWVEVVTDQMFSDHAPSFVEGTRILVDRRSTSLENGGLYIFNLAGSGEYVFRQYVGYDGAGFLRPLKSVYSPAPLPDDAIVIGRVVDSRQKGL